MPRLLQKTDLLYRVIDPDDIDDDGEILATAFEDIGKDQALGGARMGESW